MTEHLPKALRDIALWCKNDGALSEEVDLLAAAAEVERLTAENERLRAALKLVVDTNLDKYDNGPCDELAMIAENALNQQTTDLSDD